MGIPTGGEGPRERTRAQSSLPLAPVGYLPMPKARSYERVIEITDPDAARACFAELVYEYCQEHPAVTVDEAQTAVRVGIGYFAGYFDNATRERVERLFECEHPYFGSIAKNGPPTASEALEIGIAFGRLVRGKSDGDA
jgi:hypothetical protein